MRQKPSIKSKRTFVKFLVLFLNTCAQFIDGGVYIELAARSRAKRKIQVWGRGEFMTFQAVGMLSFLTSTTKRRSYIVIEASLSKSPKGPFSSSSIPS